MSKYRRRLPQVRGGLFMTDGGLETTLIFHEGMDLPAFAAFALLKDEAGTAVLRRYFERYAALAHERGVGVVLETPTWRANPDWGARLGYDEVALADANRRAVSLLLEVREAHEAAATPIVVSGNLGPRGDGYRVDTRMSADAAQAYHAAQVATFASTDADMVAAFTMTYPEEAIGIARAARACAMPVALSFTVETDGRLPSGDTLAAAIERTDAETGAYPAYYMINCAHPSHFESTLAADAPWRARVRGLRANASTKSHAELDESTELDVGDPAALGIDYRRLRERCLPALSIVGGCCGTDERHVAAVCASMQVIASTPPAPR
jgi:S-methylmethionine-dependent homocysteine/selenocysteine methylase